MRSVLKICRGVLSYKQATRLVNTKFRAVQLSRTLSPSFERNHKAFLYLSHLSKHQVRILYIALPKVGEPRDGGAVYDAMIGRPRDIHQSARLHTSLSTITIQQISVSMIIEMNAQSTLTLQSTPQRLAFQPYLHTEARLEVFQMHQLRPAGPLQLARHRCHLHYRYWTRRMFRRSVDSQ